MKKIIPIVVGIFGGILASSLLFQPRIITKTKVVKIKQIDTIYYNSQFWLKAYKCDSLSIYQNSQLYNSHSMLSEIKTNSITKKIGLGLGISYKYPKSVNYFILGEYILNDYFRIGGYINWQQKEVGIYGKIEF